MSWLLLGALALGAFFWFGRPGKSLLKRPEWRIGAAVLALVAFAAAAYTAMRGAWPAAIGLLMLGLGMGSSARQPRPARARETGGGMGVEEARSILGVGPDATAAEIKAAYARLIQRVHPDKGGAPGLAAQLNAARDRLLKG